MNREHHESNGIVPPSEEKPESGWVAVEERLPECKSLVFCWNGKQVVMGTYYPLDQTFGNFVHDYEGVTHWHPFYRPKPPEG